MICEYDPRDHGALISAYASWAHWYEAHMAARKAIMAYSAQVLSTLEREGNLRYRVFRLFEGL